MVVAISEKTVGFRFHVPPGQDSGIAPTVDSFKTVDDFTILKSRRHAYMHPYARKYCTLTGGKGVRGLDDRPAYSTQMEQYVGSLIRVSVDYKGSQERDDLPGVVKRQKRTKK